MDTRWETDEREKGKNEERNKEILSGDWKEKQK